MAIKKYKPTTPGRRGMTTRDFDAITSKKGVKHLKTIKKRSSGRNNQGRITVRHRGGGAKRFVRTVSFTLPEGFKGEIEAIEYDPGRSANIARVKSEGNEYRYVVATGAMKVGTVIGAGSDVPIEDGNRMSLENLPEGSLIHSIEFSPGSGGKMVRSAGMSAQLMSKDGEYVQVKLPSGEIRALHKDCQATLGVVGNEKHQNAQLGKAGRRRHMGFRPSVRGKAMNAVDHPHGGGDGGAHGVGRDPKTPWGQKTLGYKTRRRKSSNKFIVKSRHERKRR